MHLQQNEIPTTTADRIPVPRSFDQVTAEWLTQVLSLEHPGVEVSSVRMDGKLGFKPNKRRVHLSYNHSGETLGLPTSFIVKGTFNGYESRGPIIDFANMAEVVTYRDIVPHIDINCPKVYYLGWETEPTESVVLLLEDLAYRQPTYFPTGFDTLNYGQAAGFLDATAKIHAQTWNSEAFEAGGRWGPATPVGINYARIRADYFDLLPRSPHWTESERSPRGAAVPRSLRDAGRMEAGWQSLMEQLAAHARVIVHGDEHLGNLFVEADGTPGFLDMLSRAEPWPLQIARFLVATLDIEDRRAWERPLLARYLQALRLNGVDAPSFDEAWFAYRCSTICSLMIWFNNSSSWQPEATNTANAARAGAAVLDHDAFRLLGV